MSDNENVITEEDVIPEEELPTEEELPIEDRKKAINLQDLVYVRQYIDARAEQIEGEVVNKIENEVSTEIKEEVEKQIEERFGNKLDEDYYSKSEADETFYKKTDVVANATEAAHAAEAAYAVLADTATNAVTQPDDDNSTKIATTEFVHNLLGFSEGNIWYGEDIVGKVYRQGNVVFGEFFIPTQWWNTSYTQALEGYTLTLSDEYFYPTTETKILRLWFRDLVDGDSTTDPDGSVSVFVYPDGSINVSHHIYELMIPSPYGEHATSYKSNLDKVRFWYTVGIDIPELVYPPNHQIA